MVAIFTTATQASSHTNLPCKVVQLCSLAWASCLPWLSLISLNTPAQLSLMVQDEGRSRKLSKQQLATRLRTGTVSRQ